MKKETGGKTCATSVEPTGLHRTVLPSLPLFFLLFGHHPKTKIPEISSIGPQHPADAELRVRDAAAKQKMKLAADRRNHAK